VAGPNIILNTAVAEILDRFTAELSGAADMAAAIGELIGRTYREHRRIVFNGNGYSEEWRQEAARRGLAERRTTPDAIDRYLDGKNLELFARHGIFTAEELASRTEILYENYVKTVHIEALTMAEMVRREIAPAVSRHTVTLAAAAASKQALGMHAAYEINEATALSEALSAMSGLAAALAERAETVVTEDQKATARAFADEVMPMMSELRTLVDGVEARMPTDVWPYPSYTEMLYY
jgi:glutamine synthetase